MDTNRLGDLNEMKAACWLWEQGWEVFPNLGKTGIVDMMGIDPDGSIHKIQVKTVKQNPGSLDGMCFRAKNHQKYVEQGIRILWVLGDQVGWNRDYFNFE